MNMPTVIPRFIAWWGSAILLDVFIRVARNAFQKQLSDALKDSFAIMLCLFTFTTILSAGVAVWSGIKAWERGKGLRRRPIPIQLRLAARRYKKIAVALVVGVGFELVGTWLWMEALRTGPLSIVGPLRGTAPIFMIVIGFVIAHKRDAWQLKVVGMSLSIIGMYLVQKLDAKTITVLPFACAIGCAVLFACAEYFQLYTLAPTTRRALSGPGSVFLEYALTLAAIILIACFVEDTFTRSLKVFEYLYEHKYLWSMPFLSLATALCVARAKKKGGQPDKIAALGRLQILGSILVGWWWLNEHIADKLVGGFIILLGVLLATIPPATLVVILRRPPLSRP